MQYESIENDFEIAVKAKVGEGENQQTVQSTVKVSVEEYPFEYPQFENWAEFTAAAVAKGLIAEDKALEILNAVIATKAVNNAKAKIRNGWSPNVNEASLIKAAQDVSKDFDIFAERGASTRAIIKGVEALREAQSSGKFDQMTKEQLLELMRANLKI